MVIVKTVLGDGAPVEVENGIGRSRVAIARLADGADHHLPGRGRIEPDRQACRQRFGTADTAGTAKQDRLVRVAGKHLPRIRGGKAPLGSGLRGDIGPRGRPIGAGMNIKPLAVAMSERQAGKEGRVSLAEHMAGPDDGGMRQVGHGA